MIYMYVYVVADVCQLTICSAKLKQGDKDLRAVCSGLQAAAGLCAATADLKLVCPPLILHFFLIFVSLEAYAQH